jgi:microcin C transport system substrate-binding protein
MALRLLFPPIGAGTLVLVAILLAAPSPDAVFAQSSAAPRHHALSLVGPLKFGPDFKHFDWVNPDAPKGGTVRQWQEGSFDSLNQFSIQGDRVAGLGLIYDALMMDSPDEPSTEYGLIAEWVSFPADYSSVTFGLRPNARFHDGTPITPEDVVFSLEAQKKANPQIEHYYRNVVRGEKTGAHEVTFTFDVTGNRELPQIMGQLQILPKHFWQGKTSGGEPRDLTRSTLEIPLGSGSYRIKEVDRGRSITYERVADWWAKDLPVSKGQWNFDILKVEYFRERTAAFEAFKSGALDYWEEDSAKSWATEYDFPAVKRGQVKLERVPVSRVAPMQAFGFNLRRPQFKDVRVRRAFNLAFNFEAINEQLLYSEYTRTASYFDNSELKATGVPQGRDLELLKEVEKEVPPEVFTKEYRNSVGGPDPQHRRNLAEAAKLLRDAGWKLDGTLLRNAGGDTLKAEFLLGSPTIERHTLRYIDDLKKLGIDASVRTVDSAQYQRRRRSFDFDITTMSFAQSMSPGNEQRFFWGSAAADQEGSRNAIGIKNPAVDKLIDRIIFAKDRAELVAATHALDRVLLWNFYVVPLWYYPYERLAYWDKYRRPAKLPSDDPSFARVWWYDQAAADTLQASGLQ